MVMMIRVTCRWAILMWIQYGPPASDSDQVIINIIIMTMNSFNGVGLYVTDAAVEVVSSPRT